MKYQMTFLIFWLITHGMIGLKIVFKLRLSLLSSFTYKVFSKETGNLFLDTHVIVNHSQKFLQCSDNRYVLLIQFQSKDTNIFYSSFFFSAKNARNVIWYFYLPLCSYFTKSRPVYDGLMNTGNMLSVNLYHFLS